MNQRLVQLTGGLTGVALCLALIAGVPWLLVRQVGPPWQASLPELDTLRSLATTGVTDTVVVATLAVIVWIAWLQLTVALAVELAAAIRRRPVAPNLLLRGAQPIAARLVAGILLLVTALQPRPYAAATPLGDAIVTAAPTAVIDEHPTALPAAEPAPSPRTVADTRRVRVEGRDSWWALAERHLGDGLRWREIRDLNHDRTLPDGTTIDTGTDRLEPGWELLVPATPGVDAGRHDDPDDAPESTGTWEVGRGDHFWAIATHTLEQAWQRPPADAEISAYWQQLIDDNRDRLEPPGDPDLIHPGQRFHLPPVPSDPTVETAPPSGVDRDPALRERPPRRNEADVPELTPHEHERPPPVDWHTEPQPEIEEEVSVQPAPEAAEQQRPSAFETVEARTDVDDEATSVLRVPGGIVPGTAAAALAAAGIVALLHRQRRRLLQQRGPQLRLPTLAPEGAAHLARLEAAAAPEAVLDDLEALLATIPPHVTPPLLVIHDDGPVSLLVDATDVAPPAPWQADPGEPGEPIRWTARLGSRGTRRSIGLPLLATLGRTQATTVIANLGAIGTLTVAGEPDHIRQRLRSIALEVATSRTAGSLEVTVEGDELLAGLDQIRRTDGPGEQIAAAIEEVAQGIVDDDRLPRLIVCHSPALAVDLPEEAAGLCAIVRAGTVDAHGWALKVDADRGWLHLPGDTPCELILPDLQPELVADELDRLNPDSGLTDDPSLRPDAAPAPADAAPATEEEPWCRVALLGPMQVTCDQRPVAELTPIARQLLAYLATHRDGVTLERLDEAIWPGHAPSRQGQRARTALTRLRRMLGDGPDGQPLLPRREHRDELIRLSPHVGTDLDHAFRHLQLARSSNPEGQLEHLLVALALVRGEPFEDLNVSWSLDIQQRAIAQLQDAALTAASMLRERSRFDDAEHSIRQGLRLCDPAEPLYVEWARLEQARGRRDRIPQLWRRLRQRYADDADEIAGLVTAPTIETELSFTALVE